MVNCSTNLTYLPIIAIRTRANNSRINELFLASQTPTIISKGILVIFDIYASETIAQELHNMIKSFQNLKV